MNERLLIAMNCHDLDAFVACFADGYRSEQPPHPDRRFVGAAQVRDNWAAVFAGVPDFTAELLTSATTDNDVEIGEWRWHGTHTDGQPFEMRGATVLGIVGDKISWGRLYMEPVARDGADIEQMVKETYRPPSAS
ncbi:MAG TPA: nuclear transport factor 2 family protein [Acidimicrobiales bacterium]|nr:nuclear transport factor 2 family protein [Acidimicrobiales bacterium]